MRECHSYPGKHEATHRREIVAYAEKIGCQEAILVYPRGLPRPFEARVGDIRVRSLSFSLEGDGNEAGHRFMRAVLGDAVA